MLLDTAEFLIAILSYFRKLKHCGWSLPTPLRQRFIPMG
jgi:hypothetical protein